MTHDDLPPLEVDLYSDTVSRPTLAMRQAMMAAEVGNEQAGEDPTVNLLCEKVAALLGHEDAVYLPSGTMCNEIAYRVHCEPGDEIILDETSHALHYETGGPAALSGVMTRTMAGDRGRFSAEQVRGATRGQSRHAPISRLVSVENTANLGGGAIWPLDQIQSVTAVAKELGLKSHLDGARLLNAVVASGVSAADYASGFDSAWIDLSKGLGCPVGGVLAGSRAFIDRAWRFKHQFGGAMRQAGIIAAAGVYALDHHVERLAEDHANARRFATAIGQINGIKLDVSTIDTNMVYFDVSGTGLAAPEIGTRLRRQGVRIGDTNDNLMRAVTHIDITEVDIDRAVAALKDAVSG